jgi:hypothetical protein
MNGENMELILKPEGPLLSGVAACHIIVNNGLDQQPKVIMLVGEFHGNQTSGEIDYVTAYLSFLNYNEQVTQLPLDIMLEADNDYVTYSRQTLYKLGWIYRLRDALQNCYVFDERDKGKCEFKYARAHWSDPVNNIPDWMRKRTQASTADIPQWILDLASVPELILDTNLTANKAYSNISHEIKSIDDLQKIIFENPHIVKQGDQCTIENWKDFIIEQHRIMIDKEAEWFDSQYEMLKGQYWFRMGIFNTHRFSVDVYAFLRMFRAKEKQSDRWNKTHRFENIIFHGGLKHVEGIRHLLLNLKNANSTATFTQVHETVYHPIQRVPGFIFNLGIMLSTFDLNAIQRVCCQVDFHKFLETIHTFSSKASSASPNGSSASPNGVSSPKTSPKASSASPNGVSSPKTSPKASSASPSPNGSPKASSSKYGHGGGGKKSKKRNKTRRKYRKIKSRRRRVMR